MNNFEKSFMVLNNEGSESTQLLTVDEMCEQLMIGKNAAYDLLKTGAVNSFRIGTRWKIPKTSIDEYIYKQTYTR